MVREAGDLDAARKRAEKRLDKGFRLGGKPVPREELYAR